MEATHNNENSFEGYCHTAENAENVGSAGAWTWDSGADARPSGMGVAL